MWKGQAMSTNRATTASETVPAVWTELDEAFFTTVGDVLSTEFLWGAATLLASYDPDDVPVAADVPCREQPSATLPVQRSLAA
jgi:hypothetical protein